MARTSKKKSVVLGQDKDVSGKLSKTIMDDTIRKFKNEYKENYRNKDIIGFEVNGGTSLTKGAKDSWDEFNIWCQEKGLFAIYNTHEELENIKNNLRYNVDNKDKYVIEINL